MNHSRGFSVVEVLVVSGILGLIAAIVIGVIYPSTIPSDIRCYSSGALIFSANNVKVTRGEHVYYVGETTIRGDCVVSRTAVR